MKTLQIFYSVCLLALVPMLFSCAKSDDESFNEPAYAGWAVGDVDQGYGTILHTINDGLTWTRQGSASFQAWINFYDVSAMSTSEVWIVGDTIDGYGSAWHTTNGGKDWVRVGDTSVFRNTNLRAVWAKGGSRVWTGGDRGHLSFTDNGGSSWTTIPLDSLENTRFTAISGDSTTSVYVVGNRVDTLGNETGPVVLHSANGGTTWSVQTLGEGFTGHAYDISVVSDTVAWIAAGAYLFVTYNSGAVWQVAYTAAAGNIHSVCADKLGTVWAGGEGGTMYHYRPGQWNALNPNGNRYTLNGITMADSNRVWVTGLKTDTYPQGTLLYTHTTGRSWFIEPNPSAAGMRRISFVNGIR